MSDPYNFPVEAWLERLGLGAPPATTVESLNILHLAQARNIPFENLDVLLGRGADLAPPALVEKLIHGGRGGYCFELNTLFALGLEALGFRLRRVLARVLWNRPGPGSRTHILLLVESARGDYVADVGFGAPGPRRPLPFEHGREDSQAGEGFRLLQHAALGTVLQKRGCGDWIDLYVFDPKETTIFPDIAAANHFTATWPDSPFRNRLMAARTTADGWISLLDGEFTETVGGLCKSHHVAPATLPDLLETRFGIAMDDALRRQLRARCAGLQGAPAARRTGRVNVV